MHGYPLIFVILLVLMPVCLILACIVSVLLSDYVPERKTPETPRAPITNSETRPGDKFEELLIAKRREAKRDFADRVAWDVERRLPELFRVNGYTTIVYELGNDETRGKFLFTLVSSTHAMTVSYEHEELLPSGWDDEEVTEAARYVVAQWTERHGRHPRSDLALAV